jgi:hypothetical protein
MGRLDEARTTVKRLLALTPVIVPTANPFRDPEHLESFVLGLRLAAGEQNLRRLKLSERERLDH